MRMSDYEQACLRTWHTDDLSGRERILHAVLGLNGEAGEVAEHIKKSVFHGHDYDLGVMEKELGDVLYYIAVLCYEFALDLDDVASVNIEKLRKRYPDGWDKERSINRSE